MTGKASILIVDDDESICRSLALIFNKKGYETETAGTGKEAVEKAITESVPETAIEANIRGLREGLKLVAM